MSVLTREPAAGLPPPGDPTAGLGADAGSVTNIAAFGFSPASDAKETQLHPAIAGPNSIRPCRILSAASIMTHVGRYPH